MLQAMYLVRQMSRFWNIGKLLVFFQGGYRRSFKFLLPLLSTLAIGHDLASCHRFKCKLFAKLDSISAHCLRV